MDEAEVLEVAQLGVYTMLEVALPLLGAGMAVGLLVSLFQTITQLQEMTLVFVPKIIAVFAALLVLLPYMWGRMELLTIALFDRMIVEGAPPEAGVPGSAGAIPPPAQ